MRGDHPGRARSVYSGGTAQQSQGVRERDRLGAAQFVPHLHRWGRPPGADLGHSADAAADRGSDPGVHGRGRRGQPDPVGRHPAGLDCHLLQDGVRDSEGLRVFFSLSFSCSFINCTYKD